MDHFAGLDVSVKETSVCIVDDSGKIVREVKVASEPEALLAVLKNSAYHLRRIGLEAGPDVTASSSRSGHFLLLSVSKFLHSSRLAKERMLVRWMVAVSNKSRCRRLAIQSRAKNRCDAKPCPVLEQQPTSGGAMGSMGW